ncbi:membralin-like protein At1g60995 isoform X2 [Benincasa hispida]|uniref:membralin-like protein At1g60995 isoform X2 n=1 Tax=Benincasa hispida TaxID=102211 RepID=UPI00190168FE|nr:membralin-like protein At1g60995 isoform X2 [Benincasa hispida]
MDPEQTFIRVQERFSQMLTPKVRATLEYMNLCIAITLFCILVVMHANYVQQPGCSSELSGVETTEAQLIQIKITTAGLWSQNDSELNIEGVPRGENVRESLEVANDGDELTFLAAKFWLNWFGSGARRGKFAPKLWKSDTEILEHQAENTGVDQCSKAAVDDTVIKLEKEEIHVSFLISVKETFKAAIVHFGRRWNRRFLFICKHTKQILTSLWKLSNVAGINLSLDVSKWSHILHLDRLQSAAVQWLVRRSKSFEPTYLYTREKGYFLLPEGAKSRHNIQTVNISIPAQHSCFGNRWQQLLINRFVGYDTILMNSLLTFPGQGYLYNYQTKEFYNLSYAFEPPEGPARFGDYFVTKCGVLMMSLFVFFTTTMSVSFTLRETQTRMLKFTASTPCSTSTPNVSVDLCACNRVTCLCSNYDRVRTPISMKFFPRFFLLYFLVFHIYFFSYAYGFSYLALSTTAAFMQHLILYFWNRFEVPALQRFMQNRRSQIHQHPDFHITSSTILASTLHITRLNTRNPSGQNTDLNTGHDLRPTSETVPTGPGGVTGEVPHPLEQTENNSLDRAGDSIQIPGQHELGQPRNANSFSSLLFWILGGATSEGINSLRSIFRDSRNNGQVYTGSPTEENNGNQNVQ